MIQGGGQCEIEWLDEEAEQLLGERALEFSSGRDGLWLKIKGRLPQRSRVVTEPAWKRLLAQSGDADEDAGIR
jgi:hypothetical protein